MPAITFVAIPFPAPAATVATVVPATVLPVPAAAVTALVAEDTAADIDGIGVACAALTSSLSSNRKNGIGARP